MIDHMGIAASDFAASRRFYEEALAPLGIGLVMEVTPEESGGYHGLGLGKQGKPSFWVGNHGIEGGAGRRAPASISPSPRTAGRKSTPFTTRRWARAGRTMARPASARIITPIITARSCSIRTATMSRRSATGRNDPADDSAGFP